MTDSPSVREGDISSRIQSYGAIIFAPETLIVSARIDGGSVQLTTLVNTDCQPCFWEQGRIQAGRLERQIGALAQQKKLYASPSQRGALYSQSFSLCRGLSHVTAFSNTVRGYLRAQAHVFETALRAKVPKPKGLERPLAKRALRSEGFEDDLDQVVTAIELAAYQRVALVASSTETMKLIRRARTAPKYAARMRNVDLFWTPYDSSPVPTGPTGHAR